MTSIQTQIVKAYEELHLSIEDICEEFGFDVEEVKVVLSQFSSTFRKAAKEDRTLAFTDDQHEAAVMAIAHLMASTEDENLKFRCAKFIRDDATGRKDAVKNLTNLMLPTIEFNAEMKKARLALERTRNVKQLEIKDAEIIEKPAAPEVQQELLPK